MEVIHIVMRMSFSDPKLVRPISSDPLLHPIYFIKLLFLITIVGLILTRICAISSTILSSVVPKLDAVMLTSTPRNQR